MKIFHCDHCDQLVFFENVECLNCHRKLAFAPDRRDVISLDDAGDGLWKAAGDGAKYRLCANYTEHNACNWAIPEDDDHPLCESCRLNHVIPDLSKPGNLLAWSKLETAKRRLVHTLLAIKLPLVSKDEDPERGLAFEFMADWPDGTPVHTGHATGVITINVAEADEVEREKRRVSLNEPFRTLLGHFRHEVGHYYWERLIDGSDRIDQFRELFGDERVDYQQSLQRYYQEGAPADWQVNYVSAYATMHPWEDWAESWAHYLHMTDTLETAHECGMSLRPKRDNEPTLKPSSKALVAERADFDRMVDAWLSVTYVLNNLNRGLGQPDGYPFVLSPAAIEKLRFVHDTIRAARTEAPETQVVQRTVAVPQAASCPPRYAAAHACRQQQQSQMQ